MEVRIDAHSRRYCYYLHQNQLATHKCIATPAACAQDLLPNIAQRESLTDFISVIRLVEVLATLWADCYGHREWKVIFFKACCSKPVLPGLHHSYDAWLSSASLFIRSHSGRMNINALGLPPQMS
ncbi:hypothetical protein CBL_07948 [Carabus blaptoides fortunei]